MAALRENLEVRVVSVPEGLMQMGRSYKDRELCYYAQANCLAECTITELGSIHYGLRSNFNGNGNGNLTKGYEIKTRDRDWATGSHDLCLVA